MQPTQCLLLAAGGLSGFVGHPVVPIVVLVQLYMGFLVYLVYSANQLPSRLASSFRLNGTPKQWMGRTTYLVFMLVLGLLLPLLPLGLDLLAGSDLRSVHIPNRDYWLAPERIAETRAYLLAQSLWFGCLGICFIAGLHFLVVRANRRAPPRLSILPLLVVAGCFAGAVIAWQGMVSHHFNHGG